MTAFYKLGQQDAAAQLGVEPFTIPKDTLEKLVAEERRQHPDIEDNIARQNAYIMFAGPYVDEELKKEWPNLEQNKGFFRKLFNSSHEVPIPDHLKTKYPGMDSAYGRPRSGLEMVMYSPEDFEVPVKP